MRRQKIGWAASVALAIAGTTGCSAGPSGPSVNPSAQQVQSPVTDWTQEATAPASVQYLWGVDGEVFGVAAGGRLLHRSVAGTWTTIQTDAGHEWNEVWGADSGEVHAVGYDANARGIEAVTHDQGASWSVHAQPYAGSIWGTTRLDYFLVAGVTAHTSDGGQTWAVADLDGLQKQRFVRGDANAVYVTTNPDRNDITATYVSRDSGKTWTRSVNGPGWGYGPVFSNSATAYCVFNGVGLLRFGQNGWEVVATPFPFESHARQQAITVGGGIFIPSSGGLITSFDGGGSWIVKPLPGQHGKLLSVSAVGVDVFVGSEDGTILHGPVNGAAGG